MSQTPSLSVSSLLWFLTMFLHDSNWNRITECKDRFRLESQRPSPHFVRRPDFTLVDDARLDGGERS